MTCNFCQKMPLPANARAGKCTSCGNATASTAIVLCSTCSRSQKACNRCKRSMTANPLLQNACNTDDGTCSVF